MKISIHILFLLLLCLFISCKKDNTSVDLLRQAQNIVEIKPDEALILLDSIKNTDNLDADSYMQYVLTNVHAKYKTKQDISGDTLIFEAQKYFDAGKNAKQAALTNYYAGIVNRKMNRYDKSLNSFLKSSEYAKKTEDNQLKGKISDYIGAVYLEQGVMDSAASNYQKALNYYKLEKDSFSIMRVSNQIGRCYEDLGRFDSAYVYFNNALRIAENLNNEQYKSYVTQNLGLVYFGMEEYDKAIAYYQSALNMEATDEKRVIKINIMLLNILNLTNDPNSAKEYALKLEANLPEVTDLHTKEEMYAALANYYKMLGDYKQSVHFNELEKKAIQQIAIEERPVEMIKADADFRAEQKDKIYRELQSDINFYLSLGVGTVLIVVLFIIYTIKQNKKEEKYFQQEKEEYQQYKDHIEASDREYDRIDAEIKEILEDEENEAN